MTDLQTFFRLQGTHRHTPPRTPHAHTRVHSLSTRLDKRKPVINPRPRRIPTVAIASQQKGGDFNREGKTFYCNFHRMHAQPIIYHLAISFAWISEEKKNKYHAGIALSSFFNR